MKRLGTILLLLCMLAVWLPAAQAEAPDNGAHSHLVCGVDSCADKNHAHGAEAVTFEIWDGSTATMGVEGETHSYYLADSVTYSGRITVNGTVNLCLNGYMLSKSRNIVLSDGAVLNLCDCNGSGGSYTFSVDEDNDNVWVPDKNGPHTVTGGVITGGRITTTSTTADYSGGIKVGSGTLNLYGGTIAGNYCKSSGGGVYVTSGTLNLYGGAISGNASTSNSSGGVFMADSSSSTPAGTFTMYGGTISHNQGGTRGSGTSAGNVYIGNGAAFTMHDGTISDAAASENVYCLGTFTMYGGTISGGKSTSVYVSSTSGSFTMSGGTITGNKGQVCPAVWVYLGASFKMSGGSITDNNQGGVRVQGSITTGAGNVTARGGSFTMTGGTISGNNGYGVYITDGTFEMTAGSITGNNGGGVGVTTGTFTMAGGTISGNRTTGNGGGVSVGYYSSSGLLPTNKFGTFIMTGGAITGNSADGKGGGVYLSGGSVQLSGNVNITGNTSGSDSNNVEFRTSSQSVTITGALTGTIGVTKATTGKFATGADYVINDDGTQDVFFSDLKDRAVYISGEDGSLYLLMDHHPKVSFAFADELFTSLYKSALPAEVSVTYGTTLSAPDGPKIEGFSVEGWYLDPECTQPYNFSAPVIVQNLTLYAHMTGTHTHLVCGAVSCADEDHGHGAGEELLAYHPWNGGSTSLGESGKTRTYFLTEDVTLTSTLTIKGTVNLCLNGHALQYSSTKEGRVIVLSSSAKLNLCDCNGSDSSHTFSVGQDGLWTLDQTGTKTVSGGIITGGNATTTLKTGAALYTNNGNTFTMYGGTIVGNKSGISGEGGGAVHVWNAGKKYDASSFIMHGGTIIGNHSAHYGGVFVYGEKNSFTMTGGSISENTAGYSGAGVAVQHATFTAENAAFRDNETLYGGAVWVSGDGSAILKNCTISSNSVTQNGGGAFLNTGSLTLTDCTMTNNSATYGGALCVKSGTLTVTDCDISENSGYYGGGIYAKGGTTTVTGCDISGNSATYGGGLCVETENGAPLVTLTDCTVTENSASSLGGGLYEDGGTVAVTDCTVTENTSADAGGGVYLGGGTFKVSGSVNITDNTADNGNQAIPNNVYLDYTVVTVAGELTGNIGVIHAGTTGLVTEDAETYGLAIQEQTIFIADEEMVYVLAEYDELWLDTLDVEYQFADPNFNFLYGDRLPESHQIKYGNPLPSPNDAVVPGYFLEGWYLDEACAQRYDFSAPVTEDLVLYARMIPYAITQQPTAENDYTVQANGMPSGWQWFTGTVSTRTVADADSSDALGATSDFSPYLGAGHQSSFDDGVWTPDVIADSSGSMASYFIIDLKAGDVLTVVLDAPFPSGSVVQLLPLSLPFDEPQATSDGSTYTFPISADNSYVLCVSYPGSAFTQWPSATATVKRTTLGTAVAGQTTNQLTAREANTFVCQVSYADGTVLYSNPVTICSVTFDVGSHGTAPDTQYVDKGGKVAAPSAPSASGYQFGGWYKDAKCTEAWDFAADIVEGNITLYAKWTADPIIPPRPQPPYPGSPVPTVQVIGLNMTDHISYLIGIGNGLVNPLGTITRAEAATIFFRLMTENFRNTYWSDVCSYTDVAADKWYNVAVATLEEAGVIKDAETGGKFRPNAPITRAEMAVLAAQFSAVTGAIPASSFTDVSTEHWAAREIALAQFAGWVEGFEGKYRPEDHLTRAEFVTIVNRMLERGAEEWNMLDCMVTFTDNADTSAWYYEAIQEAANSHTYYRTGAILEGEKFCGEKWLTLLVNPDWAALEKSWSSKQTR